MEPIPRDLAEWRQFDRYCKLVLQHEAIDYLREQKYRRDNETTFSSLRQTELDYRHSEVTIRPRQMEQFTLSLFWLTAGR